MVSDCGCMNEESGDDSISIYLYQSLSIYTYLYLSLFISIYALPITG